MTASDISDLERRLAWVERDHGSKLDGDGGVQARLARIESHLGLSDVAGEDVLE